MAKSLKFYDVKAKASFNTTKYETNTTITSKGRKIKIAKTTSPLTGITSTRILSNTKA